MPTEPVVSAKSGYVFEKRLIEKFLVANGKCPITGVEMGVEDLIPLKTVPTAETAVVKPRTLECTSIPTMIQQFQSEWDAAALEIFTLRRDLKAAKEELAHALYTHDASCRVIARLVKERDELRALVNAGPVAAASDDAPAAPGPAKKRAREEVSDSPASSVAPSASPAAPAVEDVTPTDETKAALKATLQELSKARKARRVAPLAAAQVAAYAPAPAPLALGAGDATACSVCATLPGAVAVGRSDGTVAVFGTNNSSGGPAIVERWHASVGARNAKCVVACGDALLVAAEGDSEDVVARHDAADGRRLATYAPVPGAGRLCALAPHPSGRFFVEARVGGSWALRDAVRDDGAVLAQRSLAGAPFAAARLHPDGALLATAAGCAVKMWDLKGTAAVVASLDCAPGSAAAGSAADVTALAFSENGYVLATGASDGRVQVWDLRKVACLETHAHAGPVAALAFDPTGRVLAVGAANAVALLNGSKTFAPVKTLACAGPVADLSFSPSDLSSLFVATSGSSVVEVFSH